MESIKEILAKNKQNDILTPELIKTLVPTEEYIKDNDIYCLKCNTRRTCFGFTKKVRCICKCQKEALDQEEEKRQQTDRMRRIESLRRASLLGEEYKDASFSSTDLYSAKYAAIYARCEKYCQVAKEVLAKGHGIYLYGNKGTGKTHLTACMANELLSKGFPTLFTSMGEISKAIRATYNRQSSETEQTFMARLTSVDFLFIDDFGTERLAKEGEDLWLQEKVFDIVNSRYNNCKPTIYTSNYSLMEMMKDRGLSDKTADRITQKSAIMELTGESYRKKARAKDEFNF